MGKRDPSKVALKYLRGNLSQMSKTSLRSKSKSRISDFGNERKMSLNRIKDRFRSRMIGSKNVADVSDSKISRRKKIPL